MSSMVYFQDSAIPLRTLEQRGALAAAGLRAMGVQAGTVMVLLLPNSPAWIEVLTAIRCLGACRLSVPTYLETADAANLITAAGARILVADPQELACRPGLLEDLPGLRVITVAAPGSHGATPPPASIPWEHLVNGAASPLHLPPGSAQAISLSSGSGSRPNLYRWQGRQVWERWHGGTAASRPAIRTSIVTAPLSSASQYGSFCLAWRQRAHLVILPSFSPEAFFEAVHRHRVNHAYLVPHQFAQLLKSTPTARAAPSCATLDHVIHTGGGCPPSIKQAMIDWWGPVIWEAYGATGSPTVSVCSSGEWLRRPGTVGKPRVGVRVLDEGGVRCSPGGSGQVWLDATNLPGVQVEGTNPGYQSFAGRTWVNSGDTGYLDGDGYLFLTGRQADILRLTGQSVQPMPLEHQLIGHPEILDSVLWARDECQPAALGAAVHVPAIRAELDSDVHDLLRSRLPFHQGPTRVFQSTAPLRWPSGKFNRQALRDRFDSEA